MTNFFDASGNFIGEIEVACVNDCARVGDCLPNVIYWQKRLNFLAPREKAIDFLAKTGGWAREELHEKTDVFISRRVLWLACHDIKTHGEFYGLNE
jgi:hypothetical protein